MSLLLFFYFRITSIDSSSQEKIKIPSKEKKVSHTLSIDNQKTNFVEELEENERELLHLSRKDNTNSLEDAAIQENKFSDKFVLDQDSIQIDEYGNYIVEMALKSDDSMRIFVLASEPIKEYEDTHDSNLKIDGCDLGAFYIDYHEEVTVVHHKNRETVLRSYICDFDGVDNYYLEDSSEPLTTQVKSAEDIQAMMQIENRTIN